MSFSDDESVRESESEGYGLIERKREGDIFTLPKTSDSNNLVYHHDRSVIESQFPVEDLGGAVCWAGGTALWRLFERLSWRLSLPKVNWLSVVTGWKLERRVQKTKQKKEADEERQTAVEGAELRDRRYVWMSVLEPRPRAILRARTVTCLREEGLASANTGESMQF
ncbi:hypothetical protein QQF64_016345 [Cirrhinus molitorella]|uniref:Uncharacterized protein n=1 Tax=Cirrhinus molitorella TaxID=172907 RepID=A0ABR3LPX1_9TELE